MIKACGLQKLMKFTGDAPFCQVKVLYSDPDAPETVAQTDPCKRTLEPVWEETFEMDWIVGAPLEFSVFDQGLTGAQVEGKGTLLTTDNFYPDGIEAELPIEGLEDAYLHIAVQVLPLDHVQETPRELQSVQPESGQKVQETPRE